MHIAIRWVRKACKLHCLSAAYKKLAMARKLSLSADKDRPCIGIQSFV